MDTGTPSRAKAFFDKIKSVGHGADFLVQLAASETSPAESEFMDFKGAHTLMLPEKKDELPPLWAKCLSCFANSEGGVVIFGINAPDGKAKSLSLAQDLAGLHRRLADLLPTITEPPVQKVEIEPFAHPAGSNTGFVVCFIPASPWRPHQVRWNGQPGQFYVRATDDCIPCGVGTLRALFAPQHVSRVEIFYQVEIQHNNYSGSRNYCLRCYLSNSGPATASEVFVICDGPSAFPPATGSLPVYFTHPPWQKSQSTRKGVAMFLERPVHPEERLEMCYMTLGSVNEFGVRSFKDVFRLRIHVAVRDQLGQKFLIEVMSQDVDDTNMKQAVKI